MLICYIKYVVYNISIYTFYSIMSHRPPLFFRSLVSSLADRHSTPCLPRLKFCVISMLTKEAPLELGTVRCVSLVMNRTPSPESRNQICLRDPSNMPFTTHITHVLLLS